MLNMSQIICKQFSKPYLALEAPNKYNSKTSLQNLKKCSAKLYHIENSKTQRTNNVDPDEMAQYEPPHLDLCCFANLTLKAPITTAVDDIH